MIDDFGAKDGKADAAGNKIHGWKPVPSRFEDVFQASWTTNGIALMCGIIGDHLRPEQSDHAALYSFCCFWDLDARCDILSTTTDKPSQPSTKIKGLDLRVGCDL